MKDQPIHLFKDLCQHLKMTVSEKSGNIKRKIRRKIKIKRRGGKKDGKEEN